MVSLCLWVKVVSMFRLGGAPEPNPADCTSIKASQAITVNTAPSTLLPVLVAQLFTIQIIEEYRVCV